MAQNNSCDHSIGSSSQPLRKRARGRPLGSKNKGKFTSLSGNDHDEPFAEIVMIKVTPHRDVIQTVTEFACRHHVSIAVLSASGSITSVTLHGDPTLTLYGPFSLLSITGCYLYNNHYILHPGTTPPNLTFGINLSNSHGQLFSGTIAGRVIAAENVSLTVSTFKNPHIFKHVDENNENNDNNNFNNMVSSSRVRA